MEFLQSLTGLVASMAESHAQLSGPVSVGPLGAGASIALQPAGDEEKESIFFNKKRLFDMPFLFLRRSQDQQLCIGELDAIGGGLSALKSYDQAAGFTLLDISVATPPYLIEKDEGGYYTYGTKLLCRVYG